jgi:hypothetical protein
MPYRVEEVRFAEDGDRLMEGVSLDGFRRNWARSSCGRSSRSESSEGGVGLVRLTLKGRRGTGLRSGGPLSAIVDGRVWF